MGIYDNGTFTTLDPPGAGVTDIDAINSRGEVAGFYTVGSTITQLGFTYHDGTFTTLSIPGAVYVRPAALNNRGEVVGTYLDSSGLHGFVYDKGTFTTLDAPGAVATSPAAINNRGEVVGTYNDSSGGHGFVDDNGTFTTLSVPGALTTDPQDINSRGEVAGTYAVGFEQHGFLASPHGSDAAATTLGDLLSAQASQGSKSDFLPGALAISGGSPQSASASGVMDQALAAGARFAPFSGLESNHTAAQVLLHDTP